ncbi:P-loop containing nucleoside triphosphate hydrolase protein, partial [Phellopilus nigrolimitatus]
MWAGVPHRRGYLLYGEPGTGKSTTIHALAGELGLRIYYIQLASKGMDDSTLVELIASTPSRCIILLEDIDCAFLSREDDDDDDDDESPKAREGLTPGRVLPKALEDQPRSEVTLSGLLNVLDSVASEEGRITFATTNHIEKLDPALIRPGRIDVKIKYELATHDQISQTFLRFFERRGGVRMPVAPARSSTQDPTHSDTVAGNGPNGDVEAPELVEADIHTLCEKFADLIPEGVFSLAQVQGYLLTKKFDPRGAVINAPAWLDEQFREKRKIEELKEKRRRKAERKAIAEAEGSGKPTKST